jgi:hypothetical protein
MSARSNPVAAWDMAILFIAAPPDKREPWQSSPAEGHDRCANRTQIANLPRLLCRIGWELFHFDEEIFLPL